MVASRDVMNLNTTLSIKLMRIAFQSMVVLPACGTSESVVLDHSIKIQVHDVGDSHLRKNDWGSSI